MQYTNANHPSNIAWQIVSVIHALLLWGTVAATVGYMGMIFMEALNAPQVRSVEPQTPIDPAVVAERQRLYEEKKKADEEERKRQGELKKQAEIQRRILIEEERRTRSAEKAARSALDNF